MATKKASKTSKRKTSKAAAPRKRVRTEPALSPEAHRQISAVFLAALALLLLFACFNFGGTLVTGMFHMLRVLLGFSAYLLPVVFAAMSFRLFRADDEHPVTGVSYFGWFGLV